MLLFVYGTLKKALHNHYVLKDVKAKYISDVETTKKYPLFELNAPFPYIQDSPGVGKIVKGELYEVHEKYKENLDYFEGVPILYKNGKIEVTDGYSEFRVNCYFKAEGINLEGIKFISEY